MMQIEAGLGQRPSQADRWTSQHSHEWFILDWNARRLAVLDRDIEAIIRTHARDRGVAASLQDTAEAFEEIGQTDLAIDWANQATDFDDGHQSRRAAENWCELLDEHRPHESVPARFLIFRRWPSATTATRLHAAAGASWPDYRAEVMTTLASHPRDAVMFALRTLRDVVFAWDLAHSLALADDPTWSELVTAYEKIDPLAVLPVLQHLVENELMAAKAQNYRFAARRLAKMRRLAVNSDHSQAVDTLVAELRETHRRRPRLQQEFDRAGLPRTPTGCRSVPEPFGGHWRLCQQLRDGKDPTVGDGCNRPWRSSSCEISVGGAPADAEGGRQFFDGFAGGGQPA